MPYFRALTIFSLCLTLTACATAVVTPEQEQSAGSAMSQQVEDQIGLYADPELDRYVDQVGQRLVQALGATPYTFHFAIVDQFEPNAFASPGGYIYISRGLLAQMNSEHELAGVLAHEISHVTRRHHTRQAGRSVGAALLTLPGRAVGVVSKDLGSMINTPIEYAGKVYLSSFSRGQETEADDYGMRLANAAGYEPLALADALQGIERTVYLLTGEHHEATFFDTHPTTPTRVGDIEKRAASLPRTPSPPLATRAQLLGHLDGMWWGPQNPQQGVFEGQVFRNADMDFTITFPEKWETINTPRFIGAQEPEGGAYLALGANPGEMTPAQYGQAFTERMRERAQLEPTIHRSFAIGQWPAHVVRYDDESGEETVSLYYVFVQSPRGSYTFIAMGLEHFREVMRKTVFSLRQLTADERDKIGGLRLRVAEQKSGESLQAFTERLNSKWGPDFTASINGLPSAEHTGTGEPTKFARQERY